MFEIDFYITKSGRCPIKEFFDSLADDNRINELKKIQYAIYLLRKYGYQLPIKANAMVKKIEGTKNIYELRPIPNRIFYFYYDVEGKYVLLHGFTKKSNKTPTNEILEAIREVKDYETRN